MKMYLISDNVDTYTGMRLAHQSYLVNYNYIKQFGNTELELSNGKQLPISEDRRKTAEQKYGELLRKELFYE